MKPRLLGGGLTVLLLPAVLTACLLGGPSEPVSSPVPEPGALTCAEWLELTDGERVALANRLVGDSGELLEHIRVRQHQPEGTPRDELIRDVVVSLTKNCEVWPPRERPVSEVMDALY